MTWVHLHWLKRCLRPKVIISENVVTGNINEKVAECLKDMYSAKVLITI